MYHICPVGGGAEICYNGEMSPENLLATYFQLNDRQKMVHWLNKLPPNDPLIEGYCLRASSEGKHKMLFDIISNFDVQKHIPEAARRAIINGHPRCAKILSTFITDPSSRNELYAVAVATNQSAILKVFNERWKWASDPNEPPAAVQEILKKDGKSLLTKLKDAPASSTPSGYLELYFSLGDHKQVVEILKKSPNTQQLSTQYLGRSISQKNNKMSLALIPLADATHQGCVFLQQSIVQKNLPIFNALWTKCTDQDDMFLSCQLAVMHGFEEGLTTMVASWSSHISLPDLFSLSIQQQNKKSQEVLVSHLTSEQVLDVFYRLKEQPLRQMDIIALFKKDLGSLKMQCKMVEHIIEANDDSCLVSLLKLVHPTPQMAKYKNDVVNKMMANPNGALASGPTSSLLRDFNIDLEKIRLSSPNKWKI